MSEQLQGSSGIREDGGYVGNCTGCRQWYWNSWGAGTYCGGCLHGYCETIKGHWDEAATRAERYEEALRTIAPFNSRNAGYTGLPSAEARIAREALDEAA